MSNQRKPGTISGMLILPLVLLNGIIVRNGFTGNQKWWWMLIITMPLLWLVIINNRKKRPVRWEKPAVSHHARHSFEAGQHEQVIRRRELSHYIRFRVFSRGR